MSTYLRIATIAGIFVLAACAPTSTAVKPKVAADTQNPACLTHTASRIPDNPGSCAAFGHSFSSDDIQVTGSPTADGALRLMDPTITVHH